jgi:2-dehydro-3-deoxyphosphogluconate aldolase / (4S)-4-hydroxy-2-oxoglutarate aldolase
MKHRQIEKLLSSGIVAVVRKIEVNKVMNVIEALVEGGVKGIEVTMDSQNALEVIKEAKSRFGDQAVFGAGTVLDGEAAVQAIHSGAEFIFSPTLKRETIEAANRYGKVAIPGVFTPTEILQAYEWGADIVKVFPASVVGSQFFKDVKGPLGHILMMPTGGINLDNIAGFIEAGAAAAGVGGSLLKKEYIGNEDWASIRKLASQFVEAVENARKLELSFHPVTHE